MYFQIQCLILGLWHNQRLQRQQYRPQCSFWTQNSSKSCFRIQREFWGLIVCDLRCANKFSVRWKQTNGTWPWVLVLHNRHQHLLVHFRHMAVYHRHLHWEVVWVLCHHSHALPSVLVTGKYAIIKTNISKYDHNLQIRNKIFQLWKLTMSFIDRDVMTTLWELYDMLDKASSTEDITQVKMLIKENIEQREDEQKAFARHFTAKGKKKWTDRCLWKGDCVHKQKKKCSQVYWIRNISVTFNCVQFLDFSLKIHKL